VMRLPRESARDEIAALIEHLQHPAPLAKSTKAVLRACTSCFACNMICPEDCRPANLFLDLWNREYRERGLATRARFFLPYSRPNYRTYVMERLPRHEQDAIRSWETLGPAETFFYPGCNLLMTPSLLLSPLFNDMPIRGSLDYCCGEAYFRMGLYEHVEQAARRCTRYFRTLGAKTVYLACAGDLNMFTHVLPQFGADFSGIRFEPFYALLYERLKSGALPITRRFNGQTITVQDSCHTKLYADDYHELPRKILTFLGFEIREAPNHADTALCCGIGSGCSHEAGYAKTALIAGQRACVRNLRQADAANVGVYCSGCLEMLAMSELGGRTRHLLALVQEAVGKQPAERHLSTALKLITGVVRNQAVGRKRFVPPPIE